MIQQKQKKCKGTGKAIGYGCGEIKLLQKFGLCPYCFKGWLFSNDGLPYLNSIQLKAKKQTITNKSKQIKEQKESIKSKSYFEKLLQTEINSIVRLIDNDKGCISCDHGWNKEATRQFHAGHRLSVGSNPTLRFNLFNIYKQCSICNNWKSANEREYDKGIVNHYCIELLEYIKQLPDEFKELHLSINELKTAIEKARKVKKDILSGIDYTRHEINEKIGIYGRSYRTD